MVSAFRQKVQDDERRQDRQRIEIITTSVDRQEPRKTRIINAVRPAAMAPSRSTPLTEFVTIPTGRTSSSILSPGGAAARIPQGILHAVDDCQRRGIAVLDHAEQDRAAAILTHDVLLHSDPVAYLRHVFRKIVAPLANLTASC